MTGSGHRGLDESQQPPEPRRCHRVLERKRQSGSFKVNALSAIIRLSRTPRLQRHRTHARTLGEHYRWAHP